MKTITAIQEYLKDVHSKELDVQKIERIMLDTNHETWEVQVIGSFGTEILNIYTGSKIRLPQEIELTLQDDFGVYNVIRVIKPIQDIGNDQLYYITLIPQAGLCIDVKLFVEE